MPFKKKKDSTSSLFEGSSSSSSEEKVVYRLKSTPRVRRYTPISKQAQIPSLVNVTVLSSLIMSYLNDIDKQNYYIITNTSSNFTYMFNNVPNEIKDIISKLSNLKSLDMSNCYNINELNLLPVSLTSLNVSSCKDIDYYSLSGISKHLSFLQELILKDCTNGSYDGIMELSRLSSLSTLDISRVYFRNFTCLFNIVNLKTLIVDSYFHSDYSNQEDSTVDDEENEDDEENNKLEYLFQLKLTKLVFTHCSVAKGKGDSFGLMSTLTSLDLSHLVNYNDTSSYLYNGLSKLTNLTELNLEYNYIGNSEMFANLPIGLIVLNLDEVLILQEEINSLSRLTNLNTLKLIVINYNSLNELSTLTNLKHLSLNYLESDTKVSLPNKNNLLSLTINKGVIRNLDGLYNLTYLNLTLTRLKKSSSLSNCTNLTHLTLNKILLPIDAIVSLTHLIELKVNLLDMSKESFNVLDKLTNLSVLDVTDGNFFVKRNIKHISKLYLLRQLFLPYELLIDNSSLKFVGELYNLEELSFCCSDKVSSIGISHLSNLKSLFSLYIYPFQGEMQKLDFFDTICTITSLRSLHLSDLTISNTTYKALRNLTRLRSLHLENCDFSSKIYKILNKMPTLINIKISPILDKEKLRKLPNLAKMLRVKI